MKVIKLIKEELVDNKTLFEGLSVEDKEFMDADELIRYCLEDNSDEYDDYKPSYDKDSDTIRKVKKDEKTKDNTDI